MLIVNILVDDNAALEAPVSTTHAISDGSLFSHTTADNVLCRGLATRLLSHTTTQGMEEDSTITLPLATGGCALPMASSSSPSNVGLPAYPTV